jgi:SAM-dependent methyltransferase
VPGDESEDVPSPIDLRDPATAHAWAGEADLKRPWREQVRGAIAETLNASTLPVRRVLELGSGPGLLAERVLRACAVERYTLLDFSQPMLELSRARVGEHPAATFVLADFKQPGWTRSVEAPFDAVITMQAVHELRHKRHALALYRQVHDLLCPGGLLLVCDHAPPDERLRSTELHATEEEQHAALVEAGFRRVKTELLLRGLYVCSGARADDAAGT